MSSKAEFVVQALGEDVNMSALCRDSRISRKTGYKWLNRYLVGGESGLAERSRRPLRSPGQTGAAVEAAVLEVRRRNPTWGGRKVRRVLEREGVTPVPSASTITAILRRHGAIEPEESRKRRAHIRFAMLAPNLLWQMDYKGEFRLGDGRECHPLTILDDHSRYLLGLFACANEQRETVQAHLITVFRSYGLPERILADNGAPWGYDTEYGPKRTRPRVQHTRLSVWLLRLEVQMCHGRPSHPQTQGKDERLHRTLVEDVIVRTPLATLAACQPCFDAWRTCYNQQRPHEALALDTPAMHYQPSLRPYPETLPAIEYDAGMQVRKVDARGRFSFRNQHWRIGAAFAHQPVALHPSDIDGIFDVFFGRFAVDQIDLRSHTQ
jgi:transposase InsO family protein